MVNRNRMSPQSVLCHVGNDEGRDVIEFLKRQDRLAKVFLAKKIQIKLIVVLKNAVQSLLQADPRIFGIPKVFARLRKFSRRRDANFIPIEKVLLQFCERFVSRFVRRILQATGIDHVLEHRSIGGRGNNLILFFDKLVELGDQIGAIFGGHLITLKLLINLI